MIAAETKKVGAFPRGFVSNADLEEVLNIQERLELLDAHRDQLNARVVSENCREAEAKYQSNPTSENLAIVLQKGIHYHAIVDGGGSPPLVKFRSNIVHLQRELFKRRFSPIAKAILERGLKEARDTLEQVTAAEESRVRNLTGGSAGTQAGPIIAAASKPVQALERRLADLDVCNANYKFHVESFIAFLRERLANENVSATNSEVAVKAGKIPPAAK